MTVQFSAAAEAKIKELEQTAYNRQACLLPVLWTAQDEFGHLTPEVLDLVAARLGLPRMHVESTASFYHLFHKHAVGRHHLQICWTLSCAMFGADALIKHIEKKYGIKPGEVASDGRFSLEACECLALCGTGPAMLINKETYENITIEKLDRILDGLK